MQNYGVYHPNGRINLHNESWKEMLFFFNEAQAILLDQNPLADIIMNIFFQ